MLRFPIEWPLPHALNIDESDRKSIKLELSDEWTLECVLCDNLEITSVEIHRKNTAREFIVSGEIGILKEDHPHFRRKFSEFIEPGSSFIEICSGMDIAAFEPNCLIHGLVEVHEKQTTVLANGETKERNQLKSLEKLSKDLEKVLKLESSCFTDFSLICDGVTIPAHKIILSARSPFFAAMFANPMKESLENKVDITDIDVSILRALLMYMYTGKTSDLTVSSAPDLLFAADIYELRDLKEVCVYFLKNNLSLKNVLEIFFLGDKHSEDLEFFAVDHLSNNCGEFSLLEETHEWKVLRKERPDLTIDLLESLVKCREKKIKQ